jgi:hypothetical protein
MEASTDGKNWIILGINDEHYFRGTDDINIEFAELFQLYNHDTLNKSIISAHHVHCMHNYTRYIMQIEETQM